MDDTTLTQPDGDSIRVRLACGHWSHPMHPASSTFDFPEDALWCWMCGMERQMDVRLQLALS